MSTTSYLSECWTLSTVRIPAFQHQIVNLARTRQARVRQLYRLLQPGDPTAASSGQMVVQPEILKHLLVGQCVEWSVTGEGQDLPQCDGK